NFPLFVIMSLLGVPESDLPRMLELTQELVGSQDSEFQRSTSPDEQMAALLDMFEYFSTLAARRRDRPTGDMASTIANAVVNGEPLGDIDVVSYYALIATAGHDTTTSTISGGLQALIEHPEERRRLTDDLELMPMATEEMIRWVTPVKAFMRTAAEDTELGGVPIAAGDSLLLSYVSGNRDEDAFTDPFRFDVSREINKHVAFGFGVHFCLGAALARMEVNSFFTELLPRLKDVEPAGDPELTATTFVGGLKHLPIRYTLI
ncbi:cytochrome P450, partial [Streptomyces sp. SID10244]|nr:cytochrome P450 [Streptomyces sp. SID10244]